MDLKETGKKLKPFAPVLSVAVVASCVAGSLGGYQPPVYAAQEQTDFVKEETTKSEEQAQVAKGSFDLTDGVYNYELCSAYAAIANNGVYNKPTLYTKVLDHDGNVLLDGTGESHQAIKDSTAGLLTSALQTVVQNGTGTACQLDNMAVAGKTGTTDAYNDLWFVGYTPYYTCAVWGGYDDNKECNSDTKFRFRRTASLWDGLQNHRRMPDIPSRLFPVWQPPDRSYPR